MTNHPSINSVCTKSLVLGTAGHIDHGKSSLVQALSGIDPDRLAEEKRRGITIELGFARLTLPDNTVLGIVDVPGHERFVRQMIAGASGIDIALLCIAADDGIMPQTIEHLAVLELLGVSTCVVALTKLDTVDEEWQSFIKQEIRAFLSKGAFADAPIVGVSSRTGQGLEELKRTLTHVTNQVQSLHEKGPARLPVDRVFTIKGAGTVLTGTLWAGEVAPDDEVELLPSHLRARIRSLQVHGQDRARAEAGMRVALNLSNLKTEQVHTGDFAITPGSLDLSDRFDAWLCLLDGGKKAKPLKSGTRVHVAHGTREVVGRVLFMDDQQDLKPHQESFAQIRLDEPLALCWRDRFIIRSYSPVHVIGGGSVVHPHPHRRTRLQEGERALLEALRTSDESLVCQSALALEPHPVSAVSLSETTGLSPQVVSRQLEKLHAQKKLLTLNGNTQTFYAQAPVLVRDLDAIDRALLCFHAENPLALGITKAALAKLCLSDLQPACLDTLLKYALEKRAIVISEGLISHPKAGGAAQKAEQEAMSDLHALLRKAGATPPNLSDAAQTLSAPLGLIQRAAGMLEKRQLVIQVGQDRYFDREVFKDLSDKVIAYLTQHGPSSAADLKTALGISRKFALPFLERLDVLGITKRENDLRSLGPRTQKASEPARR